MNAKDFAKAVCNHLSNRLGHDDARTAFEEWEERLNHPISAEALRLALVKTVFSFPSPEEELPHLLAYAVSVSAARVSELFLRLAWVKGGRRREQGGRLGFLVEDMLSLFETFLEELCLAPASSPRSDLATFAQSILATWGILLMVPENVQLVAKVLSQCPPANQLQLLHDIANEVLHASVATKEEFSATVDHVLHSATPGTSN